jgi:hypothetical protein
MKRESNVHEGFLTGAGFLGAVSITALVLVLSFPSEFRVSEWYYSGLLSLLAIASSSSIIASFSSIVVWETSAGEQFRARIGRFTVGALVISMTALLIVIPLILSSFSLLSMVVAALFEGMFLFVFWILVWTSPKFSAQKGSA